MFLKLQPTMLLKLQLHMFLQVHFHGLHEAGAWNAAQTEKNLQFQAWPADLQAAPSLQAESQAEQDLQAREADLQANPGLPANLKANLQRDPEAGQYLKAEGLQARPNLQASLRAEAEAEAEVRSPAGEEAGAEAEIRPRLQVVLTVLQANAAVCL